MESYKAKIIEIGNEAKSIIEAGMMILFSSNAPKDLKEYCIIHDHSGNIPNLAENDIIKISNECYTITKVGSIAVKNWNDLGHVTIKFACEDNEVLPGSIHVKESLKAMPAIGEFIIV